MYVAIGSWMALSGSSLPYVIKRDGIMDTWIATPHPFQSLISNYTGLPVATLQYENGTYVLNDQTG